MNPIPLGLCPPLSVQKTPQWTQKRVAITGMNNRPDNPGPGYATARCLREHEEFAGDIIGLGYDVLDGGLYHPDICSSSYLLPWPSSGEAALLLRLQQIHQENPFDVLIPCLDSELVAFSRLAPALADSGIHTLLPEPSLVGRRDKDRLPELCQAAAVSTPAIRHLTHPHFFLDCEREGWSYPLVVKGRFYDAVVASNATMATAAFHKLAGEWGLPILAQQYIAGQEFNICALGDGEGNSLGMVMMRKRALTEKGKAWAGTTIEHPLLEAIAQRLIEQLRWPGPMEIEMICDSQGKFHLLEINPRFPAWVYLTHGAGCNLPARLLQYISHGRCATEKARSGMTFIRYAEEQIVPMAELEAMTVNGSRILSTGFSKTQCVANTRVTVQLIDQDLERIL